MRTVRYGDSNTQSNPGSGVRVIGVAVDGKSTSRQIDDFIKKTNITYEVWRGGTPADMDQLGFPFAIPSTAILDSSGKVVDRFTGHIAASRLTNRIDRLLEMPSKRP